MNTRLFCALGLIVMAGCSAIAGTNPPMAGVGDACSQSADCQSGLCLAGSCTSWCMHDGDCPAPARCFAQQGVPQMSCQAPLQVGAVLIGSASDQEGWTSQHWRDMQRAAKDLGYVKLDPRSNVDPGKPGAEIEALAANGAQLIIGNTVDFGRGFLQAALTHPKIGFLWSDDEVKSFGSQNATTFWIRSHQAWYLAGKVAAQGGSMKTVLGRFKDFIVGTF